MSASPVVLHAMDDTYPDLTPRTDGPTLWHLCWQVSEGRNLVADAALKARVRSRLLDAHRQRARLLVDFLLLPTEIHLVARLEPPDAPVPLARSVGPAVARWLRETQPLRLPAFVGPVGARPIAALPDLIRWIRMLAWRPVFQGLCNAPAHYPLGGLRPALGLRSTDEFDPRPLLSLFGRNAVDARRGLRAAVEPRPSHEDVRLWELDSGLPMTAGLTGAVPSLPASRRTRSASLFLAASGAGGVEGALVLIEGWVARRMSLPRGLVPSTGSDATAARARGVAACFATDIGLSSLTALARRYGRAKSTLSEVAAACRASKDLRLLLATPHEVLLREALQLARGRQRSPGDD